MILISAAISKGARLRSPPSRLRASGTEKNSHGLLFSFQSSRSIGRRDNQPTISGAMSCEAA